MLAAPSMKPTAPDATENDPFFRMLEEIWAERHAAGLAPRSVQEVEEQRRRIREESERELFNVNNS